MLNWFNLKDVYVSGPTPQRRQTSPRVDTAATHTAMPREMIPVKQPVSVNGQSKDKKVKTERFGVRCKTLRNILPLRFSISIHIPAKCKELLEIVPNLIFLITSNCIYVQIQKNKRLP